MEFDFQVVVNAIALGSLFALFALGIALIFGIMNLINFAHGELIMLSAYVLFLSAALAWPLKVGLAVIASVLLALLMDRVAFKPVRGADPATLLIVSFAVSFLLQNLALITTGGLPKTTDIAPILSGRIEIGSLIIGRLDVITIVVTTLLMLSVRAILRRTRTGIQMRAAAEDFEMAMLLGVRSNRVIAVAFAMSGVLAGVAAVLLVARTGTITPVMGLKPVLFAFIATIVGGMGSLTGAVLGAYIIGAMTVAFQTFLPLGIRSYREAFVFAVVMLILIARPQGLVVPKQLATRVE